jgi:amino-acid N-acetyltransferase
VHTYRDEEARVNIEPATVSDLAGIRWLLMNEQLPTEDITAESLRFFRVVRDEKGVVAAIGIEPHGCNALLRSLVVVDSQRKNGLGTKLVDAAEALATAEGQSSLYLLTTTAANFFQRLGYRAIPRDDVPAEICGTTEFSSLCPSTAIVMVKP